MMKYITGKPDAVRDLLLDSIAAVVIGGASMAGGFRDDGKNNTWCSCHCSGADWFADCGHADVHDLYPCRFHFDYHRNIGSGLP